MIKAASFFLLLFVCTLSSLAQSSKIQNQNLSISFQNESLLVALDKLQNVIAGDFAFDPAIIPDKYITKNFIRKNVGSILNEILDGSGLTYSTIGKALIIVRKRPETFTINGHIRDLSSGEELIGASVYIPYLHTGAVTNQYGFFSITIPKGNYELIISHVGYNPARERAVLDRSLTLDYTLSTRLYDLAEVNIDDNITDSIYAQTSAKNIPKNVFQRLPYYAGEVDVVKALQMQSGIKAMTEGSSGLFVRGGNIDQNLITLDEAMIYNPSHLFGLVSIFNSDAIKNIKIYDDHMPANFGGRLSSVVDVRMAEGNNKDFHVNGGLSLLSLRASAEGPIKKETGSFLITFRRSMIDLLNQNFKIVNPNSTYYDVNMKTNYQTNANNRFFYSLYFGDDHLFSKNSYTNNWGNITSTFRWNHTFSSRLFFNLSSIYSNYKNFLDVNADTVSEKYRWKTGIRDLSLKGDFTFYKSPVNEVQFGGITTLHQFIPGEATTAFPIDFNIPRSKALESALYVSHQLTIKNILKLNYGLRAGYFDNHEDVLDLFDVDGNRLNKKENYNYLGIEPRLYLALSLRNSQRIHAVYDHNYQYLQLIQNNELAFSSLETWMPSSKLTKPQRSDYLSAGYNYSPNGYRVSIDVYHKKMQNQLDLINHAQVIKNPDVRNQLRSGVSRSYGFGVRLSKVTEKFTGDVTYSYSRVFREIAGINNNLKFPANYDIPHDLKLNMAYYLSSKLSISSFFTYASGRVVTLPVGYYQQEGIQVPIFESRNGSRFPAFHRMDVSAQYHLESGKTNKKLFTSIFSAGIYNLYNRENALFYRISQKSASENILESGTGIVPWIAYSFKF